MIDKLRRFWAEATFTDRYVIVLENVVLFLGQALLWRFGWWAALWPFVWMFATLSIHLHRRFPSRG